MRKSRLIKMFHANHEAFMALSNLQEHWQTALATLLDTPGIEDVLRPKEMDRFAAKYNRVTKTQRAMGEAEFFLSENFHEPGLNPESASGKALRGGRILDWLMTMERTQRLDLGYCSDDQLPLATLIRSLRDETNGTFTEVKVDPADLEMARRVVSDWFDAAPPKGTKRHEKAWYKRFKIRRWNEDLVYEINSAMGRVKVVPLPTSANSPSKKKAKAKPVKAKAAKAKAPKTAKAPQPNQARLKALVSNHAG